MEVEERNSQESSQIVDVDTDQQETLSLNSIKRRHIVSLMDMWVSARSSVPLGDTWEAFRPKIWRFSSILLGPSTPTKD